MIDISPFRCLTCRAPLLLIGDALSCPACAHFYPIEGGIPLLVSDLGAHETAMTHARQANYEWYREEQSPEDLSPWRHHLKKRRKYVSDSIRREMQRRGRDRSVRLLDLGCGDGTNLTWLSNLTESLYGSDYNITRLIRALARMPDSTLFLGDILDYPVVDNFFDVVYFNHVIEHIADDESALATAYRILAPGGLLVLGTPNEGSWWWQFAYRRAPEVLKSTDHVHFYTAETIRKKLEDEGFKVFEVKHMGWGPPDWHLDGQWRQYKFFDDLFEVLGRTLLPKQASSLYLLATK